MTGLTVVEVLRASHIKPWAACQTDGERLDVFNGLLLAPHLDAVFDVGLMTFDERGTVVVSRAIDDISRRRLGLDELEPARLDPRHQNYLDHHRRFIFRA